MTASPVTPRSVAPDDTALAKGCDLLRALGTPHRLAIVLLLAERPRCVHELVDDLGISPSLASQHLRVLRGTGLVTAARQGKETVYTLADDHVAHIAHDAITHGTEPGHRSSTQSDPTTEVHHP
ncbi:MAG TPA: metalloregulator ArsR/SmtB family transcription factor [Acidimicrobiales bacterium]|jgi:ArsR family transcriptional regulator